MATFRTTLLFAVLVLVLVGGVYFAIAPRAARASVAPQGFVKDDLYVAADPSTANLADAVAVCQQAAPWLSTPQLKHTLNTRYEHRLGLPR